LWKETWEWEGWGGLSFPYQSHLAILFSLLSFSDLSFFIIVIKLSEIHQHKSPIYISQHHRRPFKQISQREEKIIPRYSDSQGLNFKKPSHHNNPPPAASRFVWEWMMENATSLISVVRLIDWLSIYIIWKMNGIKMSQMQT
jgi:hypothetical protein